VIHARRDDDRLRAFAQGHDHGHRRVDAERPRLVRRRRHDSSRGARPDEHRFAAQLGVIALLDGRVERVHVDVQDLALVRHVSPRLS
jgi:hypothetical protein